jgi:predicted kinase
MQPSKRIRGRALQRIREQHLTAHPLCVKCQAQGLVTPATQIDHIRPLHQGGTDTPDNRQGLCDACHLEKSKTERGHRHKIKIGIDGYVVDRIGPLLHPTLKPSAIPLTIVCGPAGAGKSTYVAKHAAPGDTVIDMDMIRVELGISPDHWGEDTLERSLVRRNRMLTNLATSIKGSAWFIVSAATAEERDWWRKALKPTRVVVVLAGAETCVARIRASRIGRDRVERACRAAGKWWANYSRNESDLEITT